jgi:hypothetical protein
VDRERIEKALLFLTLALVAAKCVLSTTSLAMSTTHWTSWQSLNLATSLSLWIPLAGWLLLGPATLRIIRYEPVLLALGAFSILSMAWAVHPPSALVFGFELISIAAALFLLTQLRPPEALATIYRVLFGICVFVFLVGIAQHLFMFTPAAEKALTQFRETGNLAFQRVYLRQVMSVFLYTNHYAALTAILLCILGGLAIDLPRRKWIPLVGIAAALMMLLSTSSRSALGSLALIGCLGGAVLLKRAGSRLAKVPLILAGLAVVGGLVVILLDQRRAIWGAALGGAMQSPVWGQGGGNFGDVYPAWKFAGEESSGYAFNDLIQIFCELGLIGLLLFGLFWGICLWRSFPRSSTPPEDTGSSRGTMAAAILPIGLGLGWVFGSHLPNFSGLTRTIGGSISLLICTGLAALACAFVPMPRSGTRLGMWLVLVAFTTHMFLDFQVYQTNLLLIVCLWALVSILLQQRPIPFRIPRIASRIAGGVVAVGAILFYFLLVSPWLEADGLKFRGRNIEAVLRQAADVNRADPEPWDRIAALRLSRGDLEGTLDAVRCSLDRRSTAGNWMNLGVILNALGRSQEAVTALTKARTLDPMNPTIRFRSGEALLAVGDKEEAMRQLEEALRLHSMPQRWSPRLDPDHEIRLRRLLDPAR